MQIGLFFELMTPRPWQVDDERRIVQETLEQIELADKLGYHSAWAVEHHFLEEYSHCSAPEVLLGAASQRTKNIRLGHGIIPLHPRYNPPARIAERVAMLDLASNGRVDFGTGETSSAQELEGFGIPYAEKHEAYLEVLPEIAKMMVQTPYEGHQGKAFSMPPRNVIPKPLQKPHPPIWMAAASKERSADAARLGIGSMGFSSVEPEQVPAWIDDYYTAFENEAVPAGYAVNPSLLFVSGFYCAHDEEEAIAKGIDGAHFFGYAHGFYSKFGEHRPGRTNIWDGFVENRESMGYSRKAIVADGKALRTKLDAEVQTGAGPSLHSSVRGSVGTPDQIREYLRKFEDAGADQVLLLAQLGHTKHEDVMASMELFAETVLPEFIDRDETFRIAKAKRLEPMIEKVMARRRPDGEPVDVVVPSIGVYKEQQLGLMAEREAAGNPA